MSILNHCSNSSEDPMFSLSNSEEAENQLRGWQRVAQFLTRACCQLKVPERHVEHPIIPFKQAVRCFIQSV